MNNNEFYRLYTKFGVHSWPLLTDWSAHGAPDKLVRLRCGYDSSKPIYRNVWMFDVGYELDLLVYQKEQTMMNLSGFLIAAFRAAVWALQTKRRG